MDARLFDMLPVVVCEIAAIYDDNGRIVDLEWTAANRLMNESILPDGGSIVGMRVFEFDPSYRHAEMSLNVIRVIETGKPITFTTGLGRAAKMLGKVMRTTIIPTEKGALCCSHEVTDLAIERDNALRSFELARAACNHALHAIVLSDEQGLIRYANPALCELLGYREAELLNHDVGILFGQKTFRPSVSLSSALNSDIKHGKLIRRVADAEAVTRSGERIHIQAATSSARLYETGSVMFITYIRDVRKERQQEQELQEALENAEHATRLKSEFLANMSHEIRTPLNGVLGMAQVLAHGDLTAEQSDQVGVILDSGQTLMALLNDILDLSKIEAGRMEITPIPGDIRHKLSRIYKLHEASAREKGINIRVFTDPAVPSRLLFDPVRVRQCLGNLLSNAIKFTHEGEVMIVVTSEQVTEDQHRLILHVTDTGCGIASDKIDRIFESFAQEDGSITRKFGGTGLGLPITRHLARMMGGDVRVVSEAGRGSIFTLTFLAGTVASQDKTTPRLASRPVRAKSSELSGCHALIVDDNGINRRVARSFLEYYGLIISEAADGNEALDILEKQPFDIVLMDIHMPGLDGEQAFKQLRISGNMNQHVPVIALTADSMHGDREKFLAKGFNGYVSKPIEERTMMTVISQLLSIPGDDTADLLAAV